MTALLCSTAMMQVKFAHNEPQKALCFKSCILC